jgi:tRNA1Val (adenine37-N6)-methyltransferase
VLTCDALFNGELLLYQDQDGYRFSLDAVLLAGLTRIEDSDRIIDLGTGCGVVPLILAHRKQGQECVGVEIQSELVELARKNVAANGCGSRVQIAAMDYREAPCHFSPGAFDLVVSNPPYRRLTTGRINPNRQRAQARHEITGSVEDVYAAAKFLLPDGGRLAVVYSATRLARLMVAASRHGFAAKRLTLIHSREGSPASLVHLECRKAGGEELRVEPPLHIYQAEGRLTEEVQRLYQTYNPLCGEKACVSPGGERDHGSGLDR